MDGIDLDKVVVDEIGAIKQVEPEKVIPAQEILIDLDELETTQSNELGEIAKRKTAIQQSADRISELTASTSKRQIIIDQARSKMPQ